jgi:hypothetical protein
VVQEEQGNKMGKKGHELIPSARRLITSLRDLGYDFAAAVADVVDNSIEARATKIAIDVRFDGDDSWVRITDNGKGMKPAEIREALRFGSNREYDLQESLGKFGLGLKTASMSQCRRLSVASRSSEDRAEIYAHSWDLEHVEKTDKWEILGVSRDQHPELLRDPLLEHTGTVVLWQRLDRILGFKHPYGEMAKKRLSAMCRELEEHLAMVFHRFISGETGRRKVRIGVNGNPIKPWDPFARQEAKTKQLQPVTLTYDHDGVRGDIQIEPYVLPHQDDFSSPLAHAAAAGPLKWNRQQGFYIYRAHRMIQSGGWSNLRTLDEHTKLARVAVSFDPRLDAAFNINVAKMRVQLPSQLRDQFEKAIGPIVKIAQSTYRRSEGGGRRTSTHPTTTAGTGKPGAPVDSLEARAALRVSAVAHRVDTQKGSGLWTFDDIRREAERVATVKERPVIVSVFERLAKELGRG